MCPGRRAAACSWSGSHLHVLSALPTARHSQWRAMLLPLGGAITQESHSILMAASLLLLLQYTSLSTIFTSAAMTAQQKDSHFKLLRRALWEGVRCASEQQAVLQPAPLPHCLGCAPAMSWEPPEAAEGQTLQNGQTILEGMQFFSPWLPAQE